MATIEKRGKRYRVKIYHAGKFESATFGLKGEAAAWALQREAELDGRALPTKTLADACARYARDVAPKHRGGRWEIVRLKSIRALPIAARRLEKLSPVDFAQWRDERLKSVSDATVLREINLINSVLESARRDWGWIRTNPLKSMRKPKAPPSRKRRVTQAEIDALITASGLNGAPESKTQLTVHAFLFALETAMRSGEILAIEWANVGDDSVTLPKTKNGDAREVPLSPRARELLNLLPRNAKPFNIATGTRDTLFRKLTLSAGLTDLHFHDSRAEAIWRLSKKLDILELARMVGHRDLSSLMLYYRSTSKELADKLAK